MNILPSFTILGAYSSSGDQDLPPTAEAVAIPSSTTAGTPIFIVWSSSNIVQIEIIGNNETDPVVNSGIISTSGAGFYEISNGFTHSITLTFNAYAVVGNPAAITQTIPIVIT